MIKIKNGRIYLDWKDITDKPRINYVGFSKDGPVLLRPSPLEDRANGTCIVPESDWDRVYYWVYWKGKEVAYCSHRKDAEKVLDMCEQQQWDAEHCKEEDELDFYNNNIID